MAHIKCEHYHILTPHCSFVPSNYCVLWTTNCLTLYLEDAQRVFVVFNCDFPVLTHANFFSFTIVVYKFCQYTASWKNLNSDTKDCTRNKEWPESWMTTLEFLLWELGGSYPLLYRLRPKMVIRNLVISSVLFHCLQLIFNLPSYRLQDFFIVHLICKC